MRAFQCGLMGWRAGGLSVDMPRSPSSPRLSGLRCGPWRPLRGPLTPLVRCTRPRQWGRGDGGSPRSVCGRRSLKG